MSSMPRPKSEVEPPTAVLDTNVLLDWLVFEEPSVASLVAALEAGTLRWVATQAMLDEFGDVLGRAEFDRFTARRPTAMTAAQRLCMLVPAQPVPLDRQLNCSDPDDQKFIDLAMTHPTRWLLSRDKALLRLASKARVHGVEVLSPAAWGPN